MPYTVLLSEDAEQDIEDLYRFIARRDGVETAERILGELGAAASSPGRYASSMERPKGTRTDRIHRIPRATSQTVAHSKARTLLRNRPVAD